MLPYGEPHNDWLSLDAAYRRRELLPPIGNTNWFGFVELVDPEGKAFDETSSREGLTQNVFYCELVEFVAGALKAAALRVAAARGKKQTAGQKGQLTSFRYPAARFTQPMHINNDGDIYGSFLLRGETEQRFFLYRNDAFVELPSLQGQDIPFIDNDYSGTRYPGSVWTGIGSANSRGDVVGSYQLPNSGDTHGFAYVNGAYTTIPNTIGIFGINNLGVMVGHSRLAPELGAIITVPEPSTITLLFAATALLLARKTPRRNLAHDPGCYQGAITLACSSDEQSRAGLAV